VLAVQNQGLCMDGPSFARLRKLACSVPIDDIEIGSEQLGPRYYISQGIGSRRVRLR